MARFKTILASLTGGIKNWSVVSVLNFLLFIGFSNFSLNWTNFYILLLTSLIISLDIMLVKFFAFLIYKKLDRNDYIELEVVKQPNEKKKKETNVLDAAYLENIPENLWNRREIFFRGNGNLDGAAMTLINEGFSADQVFALVNLVSDGIVTQSTLANFDTHVKPIYFKFGCFRVTYKRGISELLDTLDKPQGITDIFFCGIAGFACSLTSFLIRTDDFLLKVTTPISLATCLNSLIHSPSFDPHSLSVDAKDAKYSRCVNMIMLCFNVYGISLIKSNFTGLAYVFLDMTEYLYRLLAAFIPLSILCGFVGGAITTIHFITETLSDYLFGYCGSATLNISLIYLFSGVFWMALLYSFTLIKNDTLQRLLSSFFGIIGSVITVPNSFSIEAKTVKWIPISVTLAFFGAMLTEVFQNEIFVHCICGYLFIIDVFIPYFQVHRNFLFKRVLLIKPMNPLLRTILDVLRPFLYSYLIYFSNPEYYEILVSYRTCFTMPHFGIMAIIIKNFLITFDIEGTTNLFLVFSILRKLITVIRICMEYMHARYFIFELAENDTIPNFLDLFKNLYLLLRIPIGLPLTLPTMIYSFSTGCVMSIYMGKKMIFLPTPPKATPFYNIKSEFIDQDHLIEVPIYKSLQEGLSYDLLRYELGCVLYGDFYLLVDGDFIAMIQILSLDMYSICFQIRGLEYIEMTPCNINESAILKSITQNLHSNTTIDFFLSYHFHNYFMLEMITHTKTPLASVCLSIYNDLPILRVHCVYFILHKFFSLHDDSNVLLTFIDGKRVKNIFEVFHTTSKYSNTSSNDIPSNINQQSVNDMNSSLAHKLREFYDIENNEKIQMITKFMFNILNIISSDPNSPYIADYFNSDPSGLVTLFIKLCLLQSAYYTPENIDEQARFEDVKDFLRNIYNTGVENVLSGDETYSMCKNPTSVLRFTRQKRNWALFYIYSYIVRGYWENEVNSVIFHTIDFKERYSVNADFTTLRSTINQSCNQPVGSPVFVSDAILRVR